MRYELYQLLEYIRTESDRRFGAWVGEPDWNLSDGKLNLALYAKVSEASSFHSIVRLDDIAHTSNCGLFLDITEEQAESLFDQIDHATRSPARSERERQQKEGE